MTDLPSKTLKVRGCSIGLIRTGDHITIDAEKNLLTVDLSEKELAERFGTPEYQVLLVAEKYQTGE